MIGSDVVGEREVPGTPPDLLEAILGSTRRAVEIARAIRPLAVLEKLSGEREPQGKLFGEVLSSHKSLSVIAECKRRSPSSGVLREDYRPAPIASAYEAAGAAAISVLTEPAFFDGALDHLTLVRHTVAVPVLRKDFILCDYQLWESRAAGADAVLLIVAALDDVELSGLLKLAKDLRLAVIVEVHTERELHRAIAADAEIIGVNNRNLRSLEVDTSVSLSLIDAIPKDTVAIAESGIGSSGDLDKLSARGYRGFLVGESLVTQGDPGAALRDLVRRPKPTDVGGR